MLNAIRCKTKVLQLGTGWDHASGIMYPCIDPFFITAADSNANSTDSAWMEQALDIAGDSAQYPGYAEVGEWMDEYNLYSQLDADSLLLNSNPDLLYFYTESQAGLIDEIRAAEEAIKVLCAPDTDSSNVEQRFNAAHATNNAIANGETWEMNEFEVNHLYLKLMAGQVDTPGYDTLYTDSLLMITLPQTELLTSSEQTYLHNLAYSCPFAEGYAVYKARTLWSMLRPDAKYDDRLLCIVTQNKSEVATGNFEDYLNNLLIQPSGNQPPVAEIVATKEAGDIATAEQNVSVFPNPANDKLTIQYGLCTPGEFILNNALGQEVLRVAFDKFSDKLTVSTGHISPGVYTYKCTFQRCAPQFGKININR